MEIPNAGEEKKDTSKDFGKVIDVLHNKNKLSSLRTYQGDMAEFIKSKDESIVSIVVKEKERKAEKEAEAKVESQKFEPLSKPKELKKSNKSGLQVNFTMLFLSILLIGGGALASLYIFQFIKTPTQNNLMTLKEEIIPYNSSIILTDATNVNLGKEISELAFISGINIIKISNKSDATILKAKDFFDFLEVSLPSGLLRTLKDQYVVGVISQNEEKSPFIIITVNDFGGAFSAMLEWEESIAEDLAFLNTETNTVTVASTTISMKPEVFSWKDVIIKNKDTRGLVNGKGKSQIAYTFLDKNTILITGNIFVIGEISSVYASRAFTR